ncbi:hypothetical protein M2175_003862 [Bradyrhizobium elkanii]|uniref:hypothetical protein n=1 Tax=Bradyrhizobium TaxID=374 RepID=UPI00216A7F38|nr:MULTISPECIES: hypothetical protein [Bradyrhizobium]MCS3928831.1 hypothetical protein [Bradyrhizobium elkanii]MCS3969385.1 hypothetical protein [Bradyrhizobium japonicum]
MLGSSEDILDRMRTREVTGVFHSRKALIDAAEDLLVAGIDRADIDVSASVDELDRRLNYQSIPAADLADMPITPRQSFMGIDDVLSVEAVAGSIAGCIVAIAVAAILVARDTEPLYVGSFSILSGLIVGGIAVTRVRRRLYRERTLGLEKQSEWQGLLIWVRVRSPEKEAEAQEILARHGAGAVHVHEIELAKTPEDLPLHSLRVDPWLGDEPLGRP